MAVERTFSIIKPDATRRNLTGKINARFEEKGLRIVAQKRIWMTSLFERASSNSKLFMNSGDRTELLRANLL